MDRIPRTFTLSAGSQASVVTRDSVVVCLQNQTIIVVHLKGSLLHPWKIHKVKLKILSFELYSSFWMSVFMNELTDIAKDYTGTTLWSIILFV